MRGFCRCGVLNISEFWILVSFRYCARILNMCRDAIMEGFWIFQDSEYPRFLLIQALLKVLNMPEYGWIMPSGGVLNMPGLRFEGFWINLRFIQGLHRVLEKPEYALIMLNIIEYDSIYLKKQSAEYARILNVSDTVHSIRSLYKLLSSYRSRGVFKTL